LSLTNDEKRTLAWWDDIRSIRNEFGLPEFAYPDWLILGQIYTESRGDECADRGGTQFHGLLQIGHLAAKDCGRQKGEDFQCDGKASIRCWYRLHKRYLANSDPLWDKALLWLVGPGTITAWQDARRKPGADYWQTLFDAAESHGISETQVRKYIRYYYDSAWTVVRAMRKWAAGQA